MATRKLKPPLLFAALLPPLSTSGLLKGSWLLQPRSSRMHTGHLFVCAPAPQVAKCQLHVGVLLSRQRNHGEAIRCCGQILQMVDEGKLEGTGADTEKICMIAVCYHNIAVDHLLLHQIQEACVASQNARKLARLCMAYSNR